MLQVGGMWPPSRSAPAARRRLYALYSTSFVLFTFVNILGEIGGLLMVPGPLGKKCQSICSTLLRVMTLSLVVVFLYWARPVQDLLNQLLQLDSLDHGGIALKKIDSLRKEVYTFCKRLVNAYFFLFAFASVIVVTQPIVTTFVRGTAPRPFLSSNFWLPGLEANSLAREFPIYLSQSIAQFSATAVTVGYSCFFGSFIMIVAYQAKILCVLIDSTNISAIQSQRKDEPERLKLLYCIKVHQKILDISAKLNICVRTMVMILLVLSLGFISTMLYQIAVVPPTQAAFVATSIIFVSSSFRIGLFCYASDMLQQATMDVAEHLMARDWTEAPHSIKRLIFIMLCRAHKPATIWCWKFSAISLPTFLQVQNKAYSMFTVMCSVDK